MSPCFVACTRILSFFSDVLINCPPSFLFLMTFSIKDSCLGKDNKTIFLDSSTAALFWSFGASFIIVPGSTSCSSIVPQHACFYDNLFCLKTSVTMSADNCVGNVSVPLRNLLNSIQCIRDRVRGK